MANESSLSIKGETLPAVVKEMARKVAIGTERYKAEMAGLRAMKKADIAEESRKIAIGRVIDDLEEAWRMHAELGRIIGPAGDVELGRSKVSKFSDTLDKNARVYARGLAEAEEGGYIDKALETARITLTPPRYMQPYIAWKHDNDSPEDVAPLPSGKYAVIIADPPWQISTSDWDVKWQPQDTIIEKYPRLSIEAIKAISVDEHVADDCGLFLWTTHTLLPAAFDVMSAWGFKYHVCITWDKGSGFTHLGFHRRTEFLLYGYHGKMNIPLRGEAIPTLITEKARGHSVKPEIAYKLIEDRFPEGRLEMFSRKKRDGWTSWGNEI